MSIAGLSTLSKSFIRVQGPDASRFLNGLITTRLLPNVVKKKQHTISENENRHLELAQVVDVLKNWGLMHEDIYDPENVIHVRRDGIYLMFLNSKGRIVNDCFLYANPFHTSDSELSKLQLEGPSFLIEVDPKYKRSLLSLLKIHKLSAKVKIDAHESYSHYYYNDTPEFEEWLDSVQVDYLLTFNPESALEAANEFINSKQLILQNLSKNVVGLAIDNRIPGFGVKIVTDCPVDPLALFSDEFKSTFAVDTVPEEEITYRRYVNGLFETADAPSGTSMLPFEANLDFVNGLSLEKGCYVGQELTIRTFNGGVIRKRVMPVTFSGCSNLGKLLDGTDLSDIEIERLNSDQAPDSPESAASPFASSPFGKSSSPFASSGKVTRRGKLGKILSVDGDRGFMLANVSDVKADSQFKFDLNGESIIVEAEIPDWWPE